MNGLLFLQTLHLALCVMLANAIDPTNLCANIKQNIKSILSIGNWKSNLMVITVNLDVFASVTLVSGPSKDAFQMRLDNPISMKSNWPNMHKQLQKEHKIDSVDNLIEVGNQKKPHILYQSTSKSWLLEPAGNTYPLSKPQQISSTVWAATWEDAFVAFGSSEILKCKYNDNNHSVSVKQTYKLCVASKNLQAKPLPTTSSTCTPVNWEIKKAFLWQSNFFVLTSDSVFIFDHNDVYKSGGTPFSKVSYGEFINCTGHQGKIVPGKTEASVTKITPKSISPALLIIIIVIVLVVVALLVTVFLLMKQPKIDQKNSAKASSLRSVHSRQNKTKVTKGSGTKGNHHRRRHSKTKNREHSKTKTSSKKDKPHHRGRSPSHHRQKQSAINATVLASRSKQASNTCLNQQPSKAYTSTVGNKPSKHSKPKAKPTKKSSTNINKIPTHWNTEMK